MIWFIFFFLSGVGNRSSFKTIKVYRGGTFSSDGSDYVIKKEFHVI